MCGALVIIIIIIIIIFEFLAREVFRFLEIRNPHFEIGTGIIPQAELALDWFLRIVYRSGNEIRDSPSPPTCLDMPRLA